MAHAIRRLTIDDYDAIVRIWSIAGLPYKPKGRDSRSMIAKEISNPDCAFFGLYLEETLVAVVIANFDGRRGWINRLAVDPDHRGKRLAGELIETGETFLRERGAIVMCALIEDINYPSISAFQKSGYLCLDEIKYFSKRTSDND